jgi:hypothetical protein
MKKVLLVVTLSTLLWLLAGGTATAGRMVLAEMFTNSG